MGGSLATRRLLVGLGVALLVVTSLPEPSMPTTAASAQPSPTPVPTASASSSATSCVGLNIDYAPDARGEPGDPVDLARVAVSGLQTGDVVERGVPTELGAAVRIVRAGETVGNLTYASDVNGGWLLAGGMLCAGLGVKP